MARELSQEEMWDDDVAEVARQEKLAWDDAEREQLERAIRAMREAAANVETVRLQDEDETELTEGPGKN